MVFESELDVLLAQVCLRPAEIVPSEHEGDVAQAGRL